MEPLPPLLHAAALLVAGFAASVINSIAGGGTNLSFPALLWLGLPPVTANATSAVSLWPGSFAGVWGFRGALRRARREWLWLLVPSVIGGVAGALLVVRLPSRVFAGVVPWLVLASTLLFAVNTVRRQLLGERAGAAPPAVRRRSLLLGALVQLAIAVYGGYFGAGIGILMLASLGLSGVDDLAVANGLKNLFAAAINGAAIVYFVSTGAVDWHTVPLMALGAVAGGWTGARIAQRLPPLVMRWTIVAIGAAMTAATFAAVR
ncbi:MAG TPA: sulfite exporter TauE/SafE family protein [Thermoanaerobaculia bacterium]|nr:sulfite exporter TauE/SafE family protein [Thermoanaerobaculia bacterium]